jgi:hypothetical protein
MSANINILGIWRYSRKPPWTLSLEASGNNITGFLMLDTGKYPVHASLSGGRRLSLIWKDPRHRTYHGVASMEVSADGESLIGIKPESSDAHMMAGNPFGRGSTWTCVKHGVPPQPKTSTPIPPKKRPPRIQTPRDQPESDLKRLWDMKAELSWRRDIGDKVWLDAYKRLFEKIHKRPPTREELGYE